MLALNKRATAIMANPVESGRISAFGKKERVMAKSITVSRALAKNAPDPPSALPAKAARHRLPKLYACRRINHQWLAPIHGVSGSKGAWPSLKDRVGRVA